MEELTTEEIKMLSRIEKLQDEMVGIEVASALGEVTATENSDYVRLKTEYDHLLAQLPN